MIVAIALCAFGCAMCLLIMGLLEADRTPPPTVDALKTRYQSALSRGDTRGQKDALVDLKAAVNAQLKRELGK